MPYRCALALILLFFSGYLHAQSASVETFAVSDTPLVESASPPLLVQDVAPDEHEQVWLDALLMEQIKLDLRLVDLGLDQDQMDLVLAMRLERCPPTPSSRLSDHRQVLECRVRETLSVLAARTSD